MDNLQNIKNILNEKLKKHYDNYFVDNELRFKKKDGHVFTLSTMVWDDEDIILIEYGDSEDTPRTQYSDGDLYYLSEMSVDKIFQEMLIEIEN
ncbi:MAG: hypothetical protein ACOXZ0_06955 [Eubacteriales bacterium]